MNITAAQKLRNRLSSKSISIVNVKNHDFAFALYTSSNGKFCVAGMSSKMRYFSLHTACNSVERRNEIIAQQIAQLDSRAEVVASRRAARRELNSDAVSVSVGDIFASSWGYDQTNVSFYEVTRVSGKSVSVREVEQVRNEGAGMQGYCSALKGQFVERAQTMTKRLQSYNGSAFVKISSCEYAYLWDGKRKHFTAYA